MSFFKFASELCDVISFLILCFGDNSVLLIQDGTEFWLPSTKVPSDMSWQMQLNKEIKEVMGSDLIPERMLRLYKIWVPNHVTIFHAVFEVRCSMDQKRKSKNAFGRYRSRTRWLTENELLRLLAQDNLKTPEVIDFYNLVKNKPNVPIPPDFFACGNVLELNDTMMITYNSHMYDQMISAADFTGEIQRQLLRQFLVLCFPATLMTKGAFTRFMINCGWMKEEITQLFRAADISNRSGLSYKEFMYVLAAIEPSTSHGGLSAEIRCRYIFRFFDKDNDGLLSYGEFKNLVVYMRKSKNQPIDAQSINRDAENYYKIFGFQPESHPVTIGEFLHAVGDLKLRGTSQLFRSPFSVKSLLDKQVTQEEIFEQNVNKGNTEKIKPFSMELLKSRSVSLPQKKKYEIAIHTIKLHKSGTLINVEQIWHIEAAVSLSTVKQAGALENKKKTSVEMFSQKSIANEILKNLRTLIMVNKIEKAKTNFIWGSVDPVQFANNAMQICHQVKDILKDEPRMLELSSPIYVMGDVHGNFHDVMNFEKMFWNLGPGLCPSNLLFLGDYVDRGQFGMEVVMYLFCYKVQSPRKLSLIRGNHEIRDIQKMFTFYAECLSKFGDKQGNELWNCINNAFDMMPLAATIDGKIFCCHGGIPPPWLCPVVTAINQIPVPLSNPDEQSSLAWEILWNDPVRTKQMNDTLVMELMANEGFANNQRRGTGHVFSVEALERFLNTNGFSHIIRAHEAAQAGFTIQQKGKLFTVFSSSKYCGGLNEAACILADQEKIRVLRLEAN